MIRNSLRLRLLAASAAWIAGALLVTGGLIVLLFQGHIQERFEHQLRDHLEELVAAGEVDREGHFLLTWTPADPRFNRPHSGWYWQVLRGGEVVGQSRSILTARLPLPPELPEGGGMVGIRGPEGGELLLFARAIRLPRAGGPLWFVVSGPRAEVREEVGRFAVRIALVLAVLALLLTGGVALQVGYGLRPLARIHSSLAAVREGGAQRLPEDFPVEIRPLVTELNGLLAYNAALLERARTQVGNLAHALKNPLAVLANAGTALEGEAGEIIRHQVGVAAENVNRYLHQARIGGSANLLGARAELAAVARDLRFSLEVLHRGRNLEFRLGELEGVVLGMDREDLEELLGNLMDNACKWAAGVVEVRARREAGGVVLVVGDDGPGIPEPGLARVLERGTRLDEKEPGSGLGLHIVQEIVTLYGGVLQLGPSPLGGLEARCRLPALPGPEGRGVAMV